MRVCLLLLLLLAAQPSLVQGEELARKIPLNIRSESDLLRGALHVGLIHSPSFGALVSELALSNLIIHLENTRLPRGLDGALRLATAAGGFRYVRISIDPRLTARALVAMIAHELQHAVEIARAPEAVDRASLARLYRRIGFPCGSSSTFDTKTAIHVQEKVRKELSVNLSLRLATVPSIAERSQRIEEIHILELR